jgi:hypothetical protein
MGTTVEEIRVKLLADVEQYKKQIASLNSVTNKFVVGLTAGDKAMARNAVTAQKHAMALKGVEGEIKKIAAVKQLKAPLRADAFNTVRSSVKKLNKELGETKQGFKAFSGELLSIMFFGMQLKKTFTSAFTAIFESYKKVIPEGHAFNKLTTRLSANWEFFKFQLADALAQSPLFQTLIQAAISMLQAFQKLPKPVQEFVGWVIMAGVVVGSLLFATGVLGLGMLGLSKAIGLAKVATTGLQAKVIALNTAMLTSPITWFILALIGLGLAVNKYSSETDVGAKATKNLGKQFLDLLGDSLSPLLEMFGFLGIEFKSFGSLMVWVGAVVVNHLAGLGQVISALVFLWRLAWNLVEAAVEFAIAGMIASFLLLIKALKWLAIGFDELFGTNVASSLIKADSALSKFASGLASVKPEMEDIAEAGANLVKQVSGFGESIVSPSMAVKEYEENLKAAEMAQINAENAINGGTSGITNLLEQPKQSAVSQEYNLYIDNVQVSDVENTELKDTFGKMIEVGSQLNPTLSNTGGGT